MSAQDAEGLIFHLQRFSINDGPGVRTCVFFKGCPLRCRWCHNPESQSFFPQISYEAAKCIGCGQCVSVCPQGAHHLAADGHQLDFSRCTGCGRCAEVCCGALEMVGRRVSAREIAAEALRDRPFYEASGGGVTLTGGEPLAQPRLALETARCLKEQGVHLCMETCGFAPWETLAPFVPYIDLFLYDIKETDPQRHLMYTDVSNEVILDNLRRLDREGAKTVLRCPIIPGVNDRQAHFEGIAALANELQNVQRIDVEPFHPMGTAKRALLGLKDVFGPSHFTDERDVASWIASIQQHTKITVARA